MVQVRLFFITLQTENKTILSCHPQKMPIVDKNAKIRHELEINMTPQVERMTKRLILHRKDMAKNNER